VTSVTFAAAAAALQELAPAEGEVVIDKPGKGSFCATGVVNCLAAAEPDMQAVGCLVVCSSSAYLLPSAAWYSCTARHIEATQ
jgi:hypothetical protein